MPVLSKTGADTSWVLAPRKRTGPSALPGEMKRARTPLGPVLVALIVCHTTSACPAGETATMGK